MQSNSKKATKATFKPEEVANDILETAAKAGESNPPPPAIIQAPEPISFPFDVFPEDIQKVITEWNKAFPLPKEYFAAGVLTAFSIAIGNGIRLRYKYDYLETSLLWSAVVGPASFGKSPAYRKALAPIVQKEKEQRKLFTEAREEFLKLTREAKDEKGEKPPEPILKETIIDDATIEAIIKTLRDNPRGLVLMKDELLNWIKNLNKYGNGGGDMEQFLSIWSSGLLKSSRATKEGSFVPDSFVSIVGNIQTDRVHELAQKSFVDSGFTARFLWFLPESNEKQKDTDYEGQKAIFNRYEQIVLSLFEKIDSCLNADTLHSGYVIKSNFIRAYVDMSAEAKRIFLNWKNDLIETSNESVSTWEKSVLGKLDSYCLRFSLILEFMAFACKNDTLERIGDEQPVRLTTTVTADSVQKAIKLAEYFHRSAIAVMDRVQATKAEKQALDLPKKFIQFFNELPDKFTTAQALTIGESVGVSVRHTKRYLSEKNELIKFIKHGHYEKNKDFISSI